MSALLESKKTFTDETTALIAESVHLLESVGLDETINQLLALEKKCRVYNDFHNLKEVCLHMVKLCMAQKDWAKLNSTLTVISKRRAQSKIAISAVVTEARSYIDATPNEEVKIELIKTLKDICEGKIYVEGDSAVLHLMLALIYEQRGDISGAVDMIQDVHVETYGSMSKKEKSEYILQQIRLNLLKCDFIRALIQSRKMNRKVLEEEGFEEIKVKYYRMMIEYHTNDLDAWEIAQCYFKILNTSIIRDDPAALADSLQATVIFLLASKYDNHQLDMLHRVREHKALESFAPYAHALTLFATKEIIPSPFPNQDLLETHACLARIGGQEVADKFVQSLRKRVIQHNLRVVAGYYKRIQFSRLGELLGLDQSTVEDHLSELASSGDAYLRIDRPAAVVTFGEPRPAAGVLSDWASDVGRMLSLMETTCHLIRRENMVHKV